MFLKNRAQVMNPKSKQWVLVDTKNGKILGHRNKPYENVRRK
jgi:D-alanyl-D-alanine carboxypeptidase